VVGVPGALEIPAAIRILTKGGAYAGALALGCVIRGETYHFEIVAGESSRAIMDLTVDQMLPVGNGILTVENEEQAIVRADPAQGDKGGDAARAALTLHALRKSAGLV
jgi:6,7-dimethyl-8-ribityllumazine synthase